MGVRTLPVVAPLQQKFAHLSTPVYYCPMHQCVAFVVHTVHVVVSTQKKLAEFYALGFPHCREKGTVRPHPGIKIQRA